MAIRDTERDLRDLARAYADLAEEAEYYRTFFPRETAKSPWRAISILSNGEARRFAFWKWYAKRYGWEALSAYVDDLCAFLVSVHGKGRFEGSSVFTPTRRSLFGIGRNKKEGEP